VFSRSWVISGVVVGVLVSGGASSTTRADLEAAEEPMDEAPGDDGPSDQEPSIEPSQGPNPRLDGLSWQLLVSSYYMFNAHRVSGPYNEFGYPYANTHGFGLVFAGGDVGYRTDKWGIRIDLRWGQNADVLTEFAPLSRGFATWIPCKRLTLDLGYFAAFVGVENADEWRNPTFTRGILYFKLQPFRHLGLRALIEPHDKVDITVIVANGNIFGTRFSSDINSSVQAPAVGAQVVYRFAADADVRLGGVGSPNGSNGNRNWQAIVDLIATWNPRAWTLFVNGDYQFSRRGPLTDLNAVRQWGVSVGGGYRFTDDWSVGLRGEYVGSDDGSRIEAVGALTATVRYSPVEYLVISLEPRAELAGDEIFFSRPFVTDPVTGDSVPTLNKDWFFGFWIGMTAHIGN
jgi:hypothetical protein